MVFSVFRITNGEDQYSSELYPVVTTDCLVQPELGDGAVKSYNASRLSCEMSLPGRRPKQLAEFSDITAQIIVTDSRLIIHCPRFDTGNTYSAMSGTGQLVAFGITALSKARASKRNQGLVLVAHVRYPWLRYVGGYSNKFLRGETLWLEMQATTSSEPLTLRLKVSLTFGSGAIGIAEAIAGQAARYALQHEHVSEDAIPAMTRLSRGQLPAEKDSKSGLTGSSKLRGLDVLDAGGPA